VNRAVLSWDAGISRRQRNSEILRIFSGPPRRCRVKTCPKHLRGLQDAGLVRGVRRGRENLFGLEPKRIEAARRAIDGISRQWDQALARLKAFVEQ